MYTSIVNNRIGDNIAAIFISKNEATGIVIYSMATIDLLSFISNFYLLNFDHFI